MSFWRVVLIFSCMVLLHGCTPQPESQTDDEKDPFFQLGRKLVTERDYKGAVDAFEKALELNPRSVKAHYELGLLYETRMSEPAIALYHYKRVTRLQPNGGPAEVAMTRMKGCEQEIAKSVALVPVDPSVMIEMERLKDENHRLKESLETMQKLAERTVPSFTNPTASVAKDPPAPAARVTDAGPVRRNTDSNRAGSSRPTTNVVVNLGPTVNRSTGGSGSSSGGGTRPKGLVSHRVRERETFSSIARQYGVGVAALRAANPSISPERLRPGQTLNIPSN